MNIRGRKQQGSCAISSDSNISVDDTKHDRWAIILAGGDGSRLLPLTRRIAGDDRPKQFCPIINGNTLLHDTRKRIALALEPRKTMFVLTEKHAHYYNDELADVSRENLVVQPRNAGTAPAILYSLVRLEQINPAAVAGFFPSDHYFSNDQAFMYEVQRAFSAASLDPNLIVLLGIEPEGPDEEYGWIEPEREISANETAGFWRVRRFWEKPSPRRRSYFDGAWVSVEQLCDDRSRFGFSKNDSTGGERALYIIFRDKSRPFHGSGKKYDRDGLHGSPRFKFFARGARGASNRSIGPSRTRVKMERSRKSAPRFLGVI
jgi:hypothetical protein